MTGRPVRISFEVAEQVLRDFVMTTDPDTEGYYTGGEYRINDRLRAERQRTLQYCSQVGMQLRMGEHLWNIKDNCLTLSVR